MAINVKTSHNFLPVVLWLALLASRAVTQQPDTLHPLEPSDTSSPASTLSSFVDACNELHQLIGDESFSGEQTKEIVAATQRVLDCLDLNEFPAELRNTAGLESGLYLKEVLDRIDLPAADEIQAISRSESGEDSPPLQWHIPRSRITIARVETGPNRNAYQFTPETLRRASLDYQIIKDLPYRTDGRRVSPGLREAYIALKKRVLIQSADTSSPRGTLTLFIDSCNELHQEILKERHYDRSNPRFHQLGTRIISCLDKSHLPTYAREYFDAEAAVCLKEVLDRTPLPPVEEIPGPTSVESTDGAKALKRWKIPGTQIVISRVQEGPRSGEFLFSAETVVRAPEFYQDVRSLPYRQGETQVSEDFYEWWLSSPGNPTVAALVDWLPAWCQRRFGGMAVWQWAGLVFAVPISLALMLGAFHVGRTYGNRVRARNLLRYWLTLGFPLTAILIPLGFKYFAWNYLSLRGSAVYVVNFSADVVFLVAVLTLIVRSSSRVAESIIAQPHIAPQGLDANLIRIVCRLLGIAAAVIVFLEGGRHLGFPVTTLVASAGIGGLAIALSAQGLIKGLFGTVMILLDKPYRVGERIVVKGHDGFVEEIGLRSTKIRSLHNHVIAIPNDMMAEAEIENVGKRNHIRKTTDLYIPIDTPRQKVTESIECVRSLVQDHEGMDPEFPPRVYFVDILPNAFIIRLTYWYSPPEAWECNAFGEKLNLKILEAFEQRGIQFNKSLPLPKPQPTPPV